MKKLTSLLILALLNHQLSVHNGHNTNIDMNEFKEAVVQAYNASKPFSQNFYELLGLICPESVYCQTNGTFDTEDVTFDTGETEEMIDTDVFPKNYDQTAITEARTFLRENKHKLPGCCVQCSCRNNCRERHNCCPSMNDDSIIKSESLDSTELAREDCIYANIEFYFANPPYSYAETAGASYYMVSECALTNVSEDIATKCTNPDLRCSDETIPVYSTDAERIYKNEFCARCNNVSPLTKMRVIVSINHMHSLTERDRLPSSPDELYQKALSNFRRFDMRFKFPSDTLNIENYRCVFEPATLFPDSSRCDLNSDLDQNQRYLFKRACETKQHVYHTDRQVYTNIFCYLCFGTFSIWKSPCGKIRGSNKNVKESYTVLLSGDLKGQSDQPKASSVDTSLCSCAEIYDTTKKLCREILCPPGEMRAVCDCVPFITNITGLKIQLNLEMRQQLPGNVAKERFGGDIDNDVLGTPAAITKAMRKFIVSQFGPLTSHSQYLFRQSSTTEESILALQYCEVLTLKDVKDDRKKIEDMFTTFHAGVTRKIVGTEMTISLGRLFSLDRKTMDPKTDSATGTTFELELLYPTLEEYFKVASSFDFKQPLKKLVYCERVKLDDDEEERLYNVTAAAGWSHTYLDYVYREEDGNICLEDFEAAFMASNSSGKYKYNFLTEEYLIVMVSAVVFWTFLE